MAVMSGRSGSSAQSRRGSERAPTRRGTKEVEEGARGRPWRRRSAMARPMDGGVERAQEEGSPVEKEETEATGGGGCVAFGYGQGGAMMSPLDKACFGIVPPPEYMMVPAVPQREFMSEQEFHNMVLRGEFDPECPPQTCYQSNNVCKGKGNLREELAQSEIMKNVAFWNSGGVANTLKGLMLRPRLSQYLIAPTALRGAELAPDEFRAARCVPCKECFPRDDPTIPLGVAEFIGPNHRRHTEYVHEVWYCRDHDDAKSNVAKMAGRMSAASPSEPSPSPMQIACAANLAKLYMEQVRQQQEIQAKATEAMNAIRYAIATEEYHCNRPPQPPAKDQGLSPARQGSPGSLGPPRQGSPAAPLDGGPMVNGGPLGSPAGEEKDFVERSREELGRRPGNEGETFVLGPTIPVQLAMTPGRVDQGATKGAVPVILNNTGPKCVLPVVRGSRLHPPPPCPLCGAIPIPRSELDLILDDKKRKRHSSMPVRSQFSGSATATAGGCSKESSKRKKDRSKSRKESQIQKELVAELTRQLTRTPVVQKLAKLSTNFGRRRNTSSSVA